MSRVTVVGMAKTPEEYRASRAVNHEKHYGELLAFNERELAKYMAKYEKHLADGKDKAAARSLKVVERCREKVAKYRAELESGSWG